MTIYRARMLMTIYRARMMMAIYRAQMLMTLYTAWMMMAIYRTRTMMTSYRARIMMTIHGARTMMAIYRARMLMTSYTARMMMTIYRARMMMTIYTARIMTIYRARIYPCRNSMLIALEQPQSSSWLFLSLMVRAGYVCVAIIHRTLTWIAGTLSCAQMLNNAIAHGSVRTPKESLHWKLTLGRKSLAAPGNRTCVSGVTVRCCNQLSYIPSPYFFKSSMVPYRPSMQGLCT